MVCDNRQRIEIPLENGNKIILVDMRRYYEGIPEDDYLRNIYLVDKNNAVVWQISGEVVIPCDDIFLTRASLAESAFHAMDRDGRIFKIDLASGYADYITWRK